MESARAVGLRYVTNGQPGIRRLKSRNGFRYRDATGKVVRDRALLRRIRSLAIPPAWTDVWICPHANGHLQATGRDAKGRKQHRYHLLWREVRDATKFDRMIEFGETLSRIRRRVARDIAKPGLHREKVLATIVRLMDLTFIRVGNEEYAKQNRSYGLTTMKDEHARVSGGRVQFSFRGKSGKKHAIEVANRQLARIVKNCQDIPGQDLFQFMDVDGKHKDVTSGDVNDYLRKISRSDFTAKDFRTWAGTVLAARALKTSQSFTTRKQAKRHVNQAINTVAQKLGNTPIVCRKCYVHPFVLEGYLKGRLPCNNRIAPSKDELRIRSFSKPSVSLESDEKALLQFLRCCRREEERRIRQANSKSAAIPRAWRSRVE